MSRLKDRKSSKTEAAGASPAEIVIGQFAGLDCDGAPLVDFAGNPAAGPVAALATACYDRVAPGAALALMFVNGDVARPIVVGLIAPNQSPPPPEDCVTFSAPRELILQCGHASIVLTRAGKILIRGAYISSRSSGMHRITGGSVQIN